MIIQIAIDGIKENVSNLNKLVEEYELNNKNIYSITNNINDCWQVPVSSIFFSKVEEYRNNSLEILTLRNIIELYKIIINKYENEYKNTYYNDEINNKTEEQLQNIIAELQIISNYYNNVYAPGFGSEISGERSNIIKAITETNNATKNFSTVIKEIKEKESEIETKISNTDIYTISEFEELDYIMNYKTDTAEEVTINVIEMENKVQALVLNLQIQEETTNNIKKEFNKLLNNYKSNNSNKIKELIDIENNNFKTISDNFNNYLAIFKNAIDRGKELGRKIDNLFENATTSETNIKTIGR